MSCENGESRQGPGAGSCCTDTDGSAHGCPCAGKGVFGKPRECIAMMRRMRGHRKSGGSGFACSGDQPEKAAPSSA